MKSFNASKIGRRYGVDLVAHVAGQEAEPLARLDGGPRQDEPLDDALLQQRDGVADREPRLAGAGGPFGEDQLVLLQRAQIDVLCGVARPHGAALARGDLLERRLLRARFGGGREQHALQQPFLDRAVDVAHRDRLAELDAIVERLQHVARALAGVGRALDRRLVAERVADDAEAALDAREVLVVLAEQRRGVPVVGERDRQLARLRAGQGRRRRVRQGGDGAVG